MKTVTTPIKRNPSISALLPVGFAFVPKDADGGATSGSAPGSVDVTDYCDQSKCSTSTATTGSLFIELSPGVRKPKRTIFRPGEGSASTYARYRRGSPVGRIT